MVASEAQLMLKYFGRAVSAASRAGAQQQTASRAASIGNTAQRLPLNGSPSEQRTDDLTARPELEFLRMLRATEREDASMARGKESSNQYYRTQETCKPQQMRM